MTAVSPTLVYIGKISGNPKWSFPSHQHKELSEMVYIAEGEGVIKIDGQPYAVQQGDLLIYNQGVLHEECSSPICPLTLYYCGVANPNIEGICEHDLIPRNASPYIKTREYAGKISMIFASMHEESSQQERGHSIVLQSLLVTLITWIQRLVQVDQTAVKDRDPDSLAVQIKEYLDLNYLRHVQLKDIADHFHMNAYYLSHVFKHKYNDSPINYMLYRRMGEAKRLLVNTEMKVAEIAGFLGYENANYFTILFTRTMGESPTQYKKNETRERVNLLES
ncbi:helix-turn-helix domain-containing protein [Paenibacillus sp. NPDC058174]|uniref:AraC family transcriptional regulator n=1 Tax=Paenibacillus sp. NPDC058174 TaxID=3346366 RepID=UPI0036D7BF6C